MGFIRGGLLVIVSVLLLATFIAGNLFLTLNLSLDYDNVKTNLKPVIMNTAESEMNFSSSIEENGYPLMENYCQNNSDSDYVFDLGGSGLVFDIPCTVVLEGNDAVVSYMFDSIVEESYYKEYNCNFFDCFTDMENLENSLFLFSKDSKDYWKGKFYLAFAISIVLMLLVFLLVESKSNFFIIVGVLLGISSLPFMKLNAFLSLFSDNFLIKFVNILFSESFKVFLVSFVIAIVIFIIGILFKFFAIGFKISNLFGKKEEKSISKEEVKDIVKKEVSKNSKIKKPTVSTILKTKPKKTNKK